MSAQLLTLLLSALSLAAARPPGYAPATAWHLKASPHFDIYHEAAWAPGSVALEMERLYGKLRLSVSMFAPWMIREKVRIYIYRSQESYLSGEFNPPKWSKGLAYFSKKTVVVYDTGDIVKLRAVIAHELSHLYFESFYGEGLKYPAVWLNEGLAVMMEDLSYEEEGPWSQALKYGERDSFSSMESFLRSDPARLDSDKQISYWYLQAYGTVSYLFRPRKRLQFKNFCSLLRKGEPLDAALWKSYRVNGPGALEGAWVEWLDALQSGKQQGSSSDFAAASLDLQTPAFRQFKFANHGSGGAR